jgi:excisionase family DNA binding protein
MTGTPKPYWSTKDLAEATGLVQAYIRQLVTEGKIKAVKVGRDWIIEDAEAQRFIQEREERRRDD